MFLGPLKTNMQMLQVSSFSYYTLIVIFDMNKYIIIVLNIGKKDKKKSSKNNNNCNNKQKIKNEISIIIISMRELIKH